MCYYTAIDGWYNYTLCHLAKWLCNPNEFLFKHWLVSARRAGGRSKGMCIGEEREENGEEGGVKGSKDGKAK